MSIGKRVKQARVSAGLSQGEVCAKVGIKQPTLSALETGDAGGSMYVASLAAALGVSALWLETGKGPEKAQPASDAEVLSDVVELINQFKKASSVGRATILDAARFADKSGS